MKAFADVGIKVVGFSTDGFSAFLREMQLTTSIPSLVSNCPDRFKWFFFADFNPEYLCIQDAVHMAVKGYRAFINNTFWIGNLTASKSILVKLIENSSRCIVKLTATEIIGTGTGSTDKMNFKIVEKVVSDVVIDSLTQPEEQGVKAFLVFLRHIMTAYINPDVTLRNRLYSAWWTAFFCRVWKESIAYGHEAAQDMKRDDVFTPTVKECFITQNLHTCVEINGHELLLFHLYCRDSGKPELFLVNLTGSQICEDLFRSARSMTSTSSMNVA